MNRRPSPRPVCKVCGHDDELAEGSPVGPGLRLWICSGHTPAYEFTTGAWQDFGGEGVYAEYGLDESLLRSVQAGFGHRTGDGFVEHAVVEFRLSVENPAGYRVCLENWATPRSRRAPTPLRPISPTASGRSCGPLSSPTGGARARATSSTTRR